VLDLSEDALKERAAFVRLGLVFKLDDAVKNQQLCESLNSNDLSRQNKRAVVCLFQSDLWATDESEILKRLDMYPAFARRCIDAYLHRDMYELAQLVYREKIPEETTLSYGCDDVGAGIGVRIALKGFPLTPGDIEQVEVHRDVITWFHQEINARRTNGINQRDDINAGAMLHAFLVSPDYREAILLAYVFFCKNMTDEKSALIHALMSFEGFDAAHMIVGLKSRVSPEKLGDLCQNRLFVSSRAFFKKYPELTMDDFLLIAEDKASAHIVMKILFNLSSDVAFSRVVLKRLVMLAQNHKDLFGVLMDQHGNFKSLFEERGLFKTQTTKSMLNYILTHALIAPYLFETGYEKEKIKVLAACLADPLLWMKPRGNLQNDAFVEAAVMLMRMSLATPQNLHLLHEHNALSVDIVTAINTEGSLDKTWLNLKLACGRARVDTKGLELRYPQLKKMMLKLMTLVESPVQVKTSLEALLKMYQALDTIRAHVSGNSRSFMAEQVALALERVEQYTDLLQDDCTRAFFLEKLACVLSRLNDFATDSRCVAAVQQIKLSDTERAHKGWRFFACLNTDGDGATVCLHDITSSIHVLTRTFKMTSADTPTSPQPGFLSAKVHILA